MKWEIEDVWNRLRIIFFNFKGEDIKKSESICVKDTGWVLSMFLFKSIIFFVNIYYVIILITKQKKKEVCGWDQRRCWNWCTLPKCLVGLFWLWGFHLSLSRTENRLFCEGFVSIYSGWLCILIRGFHLLSLVWAVGVKL